MSDLILSEPNLVSKLEQLAREHSTTPEALLRLAVGRYVDDMGKQKLQQEIQAFHAQHKELLKNYAGQTVAIHQGQVIDHDHDAHSLYLRIREQYGNIPILIRQVTEQVENELTFRSPRLDRPLP